MSNREIVRSSKSIEKTDGKTTWRVSKNVNGMTKETVVEQIENGYLVTKRVVGDMKKEDGSTEWVNKELKSFSKENPLEKKKQPEVDDDMMFDFVDEPQIEE